MKLIKLPEGYIVTSNEIAGYTYNKPTWNNDNRVGLPENNQSKKIIVSTFHPELLQIEFDLLSDEDVNKIDYINVDKLSFEYAIKVNGDSMNEDTITNREISQTDFIAGFQKAQSLLSDKKFSLEDMKAAWENGNNYHKGSLIQASQFTFEKTIDSLSQSNQYNIEVEMIKNCCLNFENCSFGKKDCGCNLHPKITNGKIKITKIL